MCVCEVGIFAFSSSGAVLVGLGESMVPYVAMTVAAVFISTMRKGLTVVLSFALFPKPWSPKYGVGGALLLAAIVLDNLARGRNEL